MKWLSNIVNKWIEKTVEKCVVKNVMINQHNKINAHRFHFLWPDEFWDKEFGLVNAMPWYRPFNALLHRWVAGDIGAMHDHPRWSITIVLKGCLVEETPTKEKWLTPGCIVFRTHKFVHRIYVPDNYRGDTYTLFIVGKRKWRQHYYKNNGEVLCEYPDNFGRDIKIDE